MTESGTVLVANIRELHAQTVERWHLSPPDNPYHDFLALVCQQHQFNFLLWHEEDVARSPYESDSSIAKVKRAIDRLNQQRNDWIEKLDDALLGQLHPRFPKLAEDTPWNTETPGSAIDRLSILALRGFHLDEQLQRSDVSDEHSRITRQKLILCQQQANDLSIALARLLDELFAGKKQMKVYRQLKLYNDPMYNPFLYQTPQRKDQDD